MQCTSPFNCRYKTEHESVTTATSVPTNPYMGIFTNESDKDREIERLRAENKQLKARLENAPPIKLNDTVWFIKGKEKISEGKISMLQCLSNGKWKMRISTIEAWGKSIFDDYCDKIGIDYFTDRNEIIEKIKELQDRR